MKCIHVIIIGLILGVVANQIAGNHERHDMEQRIIECIANESNCYNVGDK